MVAEWTQEEPTENGTDKLKAFKGICGPVGLAGERNEGRFDYLAVQVRYGAGYGGPESFQGCSGGGLWHALLKEKDGEVVIDRLALAGVAFYQSAIEGDCRTIECHGERSIYGPVIDALERRKAGTSGG
jgi:hypothetical protein